MVKIFSIGLKLSVKIKKNDKDLKNHMFQSLANNYKLSGDFVRDQTIRNFLYHLISLTDPIWIC